MIKTGIVLFMAVSISLAAGLYSGLELASSRIESAEIARSQELQSEAGLLLEGFWTSIELLRTEASAVWSAERSRAPILLSSRIQYWAEFEIRPGSEPTVKSAIRNSQWQPPSFASARPESKIFEEVFVPRLIKNAQWKELDENGVALVRSTDSLALFFKKPDEGGRSGAVRSGILILVDPVEAFGFFQSALHRDPSGSLRAYLIASDGTVLIHSQSGYVSADFSRSAIYREGIEPVFKPSSGEETKVGGMHWAIDQIPVASSYLRAGSLPLAVVIERAVSAQNPVSRVIYEGQWRRLAGQGFFLLGILLFLVTGFSWILNRKKKPVEAKAKTADSLPLPAELIDQMLYAPSPSSSMGGGSGAISAGQAVPITPQLQRELEAAQQALRSVQDERVLLSRFEQEAAALQNPKRVAARLAQAASELCSSPTLFFAFHTNLHTAILQADAGFPEGQAPTGMSFPVDESTMNRILEAAQGNEPASLSDYDPLARLLIARMGVAHFEAWPITGYGPLGRQAGRARLMGVLVVLQAGLESTQRHDSLCRMLRMTGLVYENALLSR